MALFQRRIPTTTQALTTIVAQKTCARRIIITASRHCRTLRSSGVRLSNLATSFVTSDAIFTLWIQRWTTPKFFVKARLSYDANPGEITAREAIRDVDCRQSHHSAFVNLPQFLMSHIWLVPQNS